MPVTCRLDTAAEVSVYQAGGVLQRFARISSARPEARQFRTCSAVRSQSVRRISFLRDRPVAQLDQIPMAHLPQIRIPATYMRGGTSKGVFFRLQDLPQSCQVPGAARDKLFMRVIGSP